MTSNNRLYSETPENATHIEYDDPCGFVSHYAEEASRIGPQKYVIYDGRLARRRLLTTAEEREQYLIEDKPEASGHRIAELVKGIVMHKPDTYHAPVELMALEVAAQQADPAFHAWLQMNKDAVLKLVGLMHPAKVGNAQAIVRGKDETVQQSPDHEDEIDAWRDTYAKSQQGQELRNERQARTNWLRDVHRARRLTRKANEKRHGYALNVPEVAVKQRVQEPGQLEIWDTLAEDSLREIDNDKAYKTKDRRNGAK